MLFHGSWRKAPWGRHVQAACKSAVLAAASLISFPFGRFQKFGIAKVWCIVVSPVCGVNFQSTSVDIRVSPSVFPASFHLEIFCIGNIPGVLVQYFCLCFGEQSKRALLWSY